MAAIITNVKFSEKTVIAYYTRESDMVKGLIIPKTKLEGSENLYDTIYGLLEESLKINSK